MTYAPESDGRRTAVPSRGSTATGPVWGGLIGLPVAVAVALAALGAALGSPWGAALAAWLLVAVAASTRLRASAAAGASVLVVLVPALLAVRTGPATGLPPRETVTVCWVVLAVVLAVVCSAAGRRWPRPSSRTVSRVVAAALPGLVGLASVGAVLLSPDGALTAWATRNDSANNLMFIRFMVEDGGVDPATHPNPAFLLQGLVTLGVDRSASVSQVFAAYAVLWIGTVVAAAVALAAVVASSVRAAGPAVVGALLVGCFTYSWFVLGFSMTYGFANVPLALLLLACCLLVAQGGPSTAALRTAVLVAGAVLLLATWAPLAVVPAALGLVAVLGGGRADLVRRLAASLAHSLLLALSLLAAVAYVVAVVLPDLRSDGGNLSQGGAFPDLSAVPWVLVSTVAVVLAVAAVGVRRSAAGRTRRATAASGPVEGAGRALATVVAGALAMSGFMVLALLGSSPLWTYYPQKLSWILTIVTIALVAGLALDWSGSLASRVTVPVASCLVVLLAVTTVVDGPGVGGYVPAVKVARGIEPGAETDARAVLRLADDSRPTVVWLLGTTAFDHLANSWLVATEATSVDDPVRRYAATIEHTPEQVCAALEALGPDGVVATGAENVRAALEDTCPGAGARVVVTDVASLAADDATP